MKKIYWFKREKDDYYFPIDIENQASKYLKRKGVVYIGWSDGKHYDDVMRGKTIQVSESNWLSQTDPEVVKRREVLVKEALSLEVEQAMEEGHQSPPRNNDVLNLQGQAHTDPSLANQVRRLR